MRKEQRDVTVYDELVGHKALKVYQVGDDELHFELENGDHYHFYHEQDCCESVYIEDICGELEYLQGETINIAEETSDTDSTDWGTITFTFYKFATPKGYVTIRWCGESNGYYSESVDFERIA